MRHCWAILILGALTSCASHQPEGLEIELVEEPAALEPLRGEPYASEEPPEPQAECLPPGFVARLPTVASYAEPSGGTCRAIGKSTRRLLSKELRAG